MMCRSGGRGEEAPLAAAESLSDLTSSPTDFLHQLLHVAKPNHNDQTKPIYNDQTKPNNNAQTKQNPATKPNKLVKLWVIPDQVEDEVSLQLNDRGGGGPGTRLTQPRMSLLGKPLNYRPNRRDIKYRKLQAKLYNFLERPSGKPAFIYHLLVFCLVFLCLALSVFSTIPEHEEDAGRILYHLEIIIVIWFSCEFAVRLWSSGCRSRFQGCVGRLKFVKSPFCLIDIVTICASLVVLSGQATQVYAASALRGLRFFQILRMVRMDRRGGTWKLLGSVVYAHRQELVTTLYIGFLVLITSSFLIYLAEKDQPGGNFVSFAHALWWGVITLCTVGYGDAVPVTWKGKIIASFCALAGISFFALPAGILGSGFALKVQQQQRQKHMIRRRVPAATLIQCLWRCYAADEFSNSEATWKIHMVKQRSPTSMPTESNHFSTENEHRSLLQRFSGSFKNNTSFVTRLPTIRRNRHANRSPAGELKPKLQPSNVSNDNLSIAGDESVRDSSEMTLTKKNSDDEDDQPGVFVLTRQHKGAIRAIRKLKYMAARRKFKEALKPYDVKDVIESYSAGHADLVTKVKGLQLRLDQILGRQGSKSKDAYDSKMSLSARIVNTERQVDSIEEKLQMFIEMYEEDRKRLHSLTFNTPLAPPSSPCPGTPNSLISPPLGVNYPSMYSSISQGMHNTSQVFRKPILVSNEGTDQASDPDTPTSKTLPEKTFSQPDSFISSRRPFKKRVTLGHIPSRHIRSVDRAEDTISCSRMEMVAPSVRIEGCTPPSESNSIDGELGKYDNISETSDGSTCFDDGSCEETSHLISEPNLASSEVIISPAQLTSSGAILSSGHRSLSATMSAPADLPHPFTSSNSIRPQNGGVQPDNCPMSSQTKEDKSLNSRHVNLSIKDIP